MICGCNKLYKTNNILIFLLYYLRFIVEKCDGNLKIENRKKIEMINELVRRGYNSDPVKAWKLLQDRESVLVSNKYVSFMYIYY